MPLGQYAAHTNLAMADWIPSVTSLAVDNKVRALITSVVILRKILNQVVFPIFANFPVLSAPEKAWKAGHALAFSVPKASQNGLIYRVPDTM